MPAKEKSRAITPPEIKQARTKMERLATLARETKRAVKRARHEHKLAKKAAKKARKAFKAMTEAAAEARPRKSATKKKAPRTSALGAGVKVAATAVTS